MTGRWLTPNQACRRLGITWTELHELLASGVLTREWIGDHYSIAESVVEEYEQRRTDLASEPDAARGAFLAEHAQIPVGGGPQIGDEAELGYGREKADYDNPNDEGEDD